MEDWKGITSMIVSILTALGLAYRLRKREARTDTIVGTSIDETAYQHLQRQLREAEKRRAEDVHRMEERHNEDMARVERKLNDREHDMQILTERERACQIQYAELKVENAHLKEELAYVNEELGALKTELRSRGSIAEAKIKPDSHRSTSPDKPTT